MIFPRTFKGLVSLCLVIFASCAPAGRSSAIAPGASSTRPQTAGLELLVLGSGGPGAVGRASTAFVLSLDGTPRVLIDAGSGAFARLGEAGVSLDRLDLVLLTHLHVDHSSELPGLVKARAVSSRGPLEFRIYGPTAWGKFPSTKRFVDLLFGRQGAFAYLADFSAPLKIEGTDIDAGLHGGQKPRTLLSQDGLRITAIAGHHDDAPAIIYRVDYRGRSIVFSGDIDAAGLDNLRRISDRCDLLVFNTVVLDPPGSPKVLYDLHTPPKAIGEVAAGSHVGALLLTHLNPSIDAAHDAVLASIRRSFRGPVTFAEDRMRVLP